MDLDTKSDLEKRLEGMTPAEQIRELVYEIRDLRKIVAEISESLARDKDEKKP